MSTPAQRFVVEHLLVEAMDGDFLVAAGRGIDNQDQDVPIRHARPAEIAWWAVESAGEAFADWCEAVIASALGSPRNDYADGWRDACAAMLAELRPEETE